MVLPPNVRAFLHFASLVAVAAAASITALERAVDPCAAISGQKWVAPSALRACFTSVKVDPTIKENIIEVINKTLAFHTSVNYEFKAPEPFTADVHEDLLGDLDRISKQSYPSDYDLHIDFSRTLKRLDDVTVGSLLKPSLPRKALFLNFLPVPLVLLTETNGAQNVHIAPEAFQVASAEFPDQISVWQNALPGALKGQLASLSGAKVLQINGQDPFVAVNANAQIAGSFQALGTRQNGFFASYNRVATGWSYIMGNFAQQSLPLSDTVILTIVRVNHTLPEIVVLPYRARIGAATVPFTDTASWRANNCVAIDGTNGEDIFDTSSPSANSPNLPLVKFKQQPDIPVAMERKHPVNVMMDTSPPSDIVLPPTLTPALPILSGSQNVTQFFMLKDGKTGVMALGSFSDTNFNNFLLGMLSGLQALKSQGATQLIVDVVRFSSKVDHFHTLTSFFKTNNGGGFICAAHIVGPKSTTVPQAGLDTKARDGPLAMLITTKIVTSNIDPDGELLYNPVNWANASDVFFAPGTNWLQPPVDLTINGRADAFSQRLGEECAASGFPTTPPATALFDPKKVVVVSNGRCASSCSLFSVTMSKEEGAQTVVVGGKVDVQQQYCGTVGGQSTDFSTIDTEVKDFELNHCAVKSTGLKNNTLAPPDLLVNGVQGITWRLAFGVVDPTQPEEWQIRPATLNLPITAATVNNPVAIWESVVQKLLN
ncbi:hypothetical protein HYPSUDRAFT_55453 [Hypholoma sublateritium FD-334 SS-4]|uniref:Tail specific protease domain-containing protein n=1 Tax=Hypholoma sublateritium (strain FD-334 SS-4) TaxID=945553 RepID=A0A0D2L437_HYPSF|nr:hypothetical protein HYPSUDRAFT_55453 [Hypholoma sublateritium FD-334 SS-4]